MGRGAWAANAIRRCRRWSIGGAVVCSAAALAACGSSRTVTVSQVQGAASSRPAPSLTALVHRVSGGVVRIQSNSCNSTETGTGFLLAPRVVATVEHVVDGASTIQIEQADGTATTARIIGSDPAQDLALLLTAEPLKGPALRLDHSAPSLGDTVAALGFPLDLPLSVSQGTVSGLGRTVPINGYNRQNLIQTDAALNPGNSGGPLLSLKTGRVIGLVDLSATSGSGLGFAVSSGAAVKEFASWKGEVQPIDSIGCPSSPAALPVSTRLPRGVLPPAVFFFIPVTVYAGNSGQTTNSGNTGSPAAAAVPATSYPPQGGGGNSGAGVGSTGQATGNSGNSGNSGNTGNGNTGNTTGNSGTTTTTGNSGAPAGTSGNSGTTSTPTNSGSTGQAGDTPPPAGNT